MKVDLGFSSGSRKWVALDYDARQVRAVVFDYLRGQAVIRSLHAAAVPGDVNVADSASLGRFLKKLVERLNLGGAKALMCAGRSQVVLKSLTLPPGASPNELPSMVQFQVGKELPFSLDEAVVDFTYGAHWDSGLVQAPEEGTTVLAAAVRLPVIEAARAVCAEAGLKLQRLVFRPYANLRAVRRCVDFEPGERILYVDLTADEAEIDVVGDQTLEFSRVARTAAPSPAGAPGDVLGAWEQAQQRQALVKRIVGEVQRSLTGFSETQRGAAIAACLVAGATGLEDDTAAALAQALGIRSEKFDPSGGFAVLHDDQVSGFGAALGMATGPLEVVPLDFLNPKRPVPQRDVKKIRLAVAVGAAALMLLGGVLAASIYLNGYGSELNELNAQNKKLVERNKQLLRVAGPVTNVKEWLGEDVDWLDQLAHLSNTLPSARELYLLTFRTGGGKMMSLSGRVKDSQSVSRLSKDLIGMSGYEVQPKGLSGVRDTFGYNSQFTLDVLVAPQAKPVLATTQPVGRPGDDGGARDFRRGERPGRPAGSSPPNQPSAPAGQPNQPAPPQVPSGGPRPPQPVPQVQAPLGVPIVQPGQPQPAPSTGDRRRRGGSG